LRILTIQAETGQAGESNIRDKVISNISADFTSKEALLLYLDNNPHPKMVFQIHPERWTDNPVEWAMQYLKDLLINLAKRILN
jgi:hypothetical protein